MDHTNRPPTIMQSGKAIIVTRGYIADLLAVGLTPADWDVLALVADYRHETLPQVIRGAIIRTYAEPPGGFALQWEIDRALECAGIVIRAAHAILDYQEARAE